MRGATATIRVPADYSSIQAAIAAATAGDVVLVSPGTYNEGINFLGKTITVASDFYETGNPTNILNTIISPPANISGATAASGESINSKLIGFTITGCSGQNSAAVYCYQGSLAISDCRLVTNQCRGVIMYKSQSILRRNEIQGYLFFDAGGPYNPIHCAQAAATIEQNRIYATDPNGNLDAIYHSITEPASTLQTVIRSNIIYGRLDGEFHTGGPVHIISHNLFIIENGSSEAVMITGGDSGLKIFNNTIIGGDFNVQHNATPRFFNNIIAFGYYGLAIPVTPSVPEIAYNTIWQPERPEIAEQFMTNGNNFVDPQFKDSTNGDFTLLPDSPCIDSGDLLAAFDSDGTRADRGAFYFDQTYQGWLQRHFSTTILVNTNAQQTIWGPNADPDSDRIPKPL